MVWNGGDDGARTRDLRRNRPEVTGSWLDFSFNHLRMQEMNRLETVCFKSKASTFEINRIRRGFDRPSPKLSPGISLALLVTLAGCGARNSTSFRREPFPVESPHLDDDYAGIKASPLTATPCRVEGMDCRRIRDTPIEERPDHVSGAVVPSAHR